MWGDLMKYKKIYISVFCVLILSLFSVPMLFLNLFDSAVFTAGKNSKIHTIILDAGHGGEDGGAIALDGSNEKDYNLEIALKLKNILEMNGYNVIMTRTEDIMTCDDNLKTIRSKKVSDIHNRFALTEKYSDAVFVSIHQNKFSDTRQKGTQVFYSKNNPQSKILADSIQNSIKLNLQPDNSRLTKPSGTEIYLLYYAKIPAVLVECGFLSNSEDLTKLKNNDYKTKLAMLIAEGITE